VEHQGLCFEKEKHFCNTPGYTIYILYTIYTMVPGQVLLVSMGAVAMVGGKSLS